MSANTRHAAIDIDRIADDVKCEEIDPSGSGMLRLGILWFTAQLVKWVGGSYAAVPRSLYIAGISPMPQKLILDIASGAVVQLAQFMPSHLNCSMRQAPLFC
jgi:hypothetical protein